MADLPGTIGYLTVTGRAVLGLGDSSDPGDNPDQVVATATVSFTPLMPTSDPLVAVAEEMFVIPQKIKCTLDGTGRLVPPADGIGSAPMVGAPTYVSLVAPIQDSLNFTNWYWKVDFAPIGVQGWQPFSRFFTGAPGDEIKLTNLVTATPSPGVLQAIVYDIPTVTTPVEPFPDGYRVGIDLIFTTVNNKLWRTTP